MNIYSTLLSLLLLTRSDDPIRLDFYSSLQQAYQYGGEYIQSKLPLQNEVLKLVSSIGPRCQDMMKKLKTYLPSVILQNEYDALDKEIDKFHLDDKKPEVKLNVSNPEQLGKRWAEVFQMKRFPWLLKLKNVYL